MSRKKSGTADNSGIERLKRSRGSTTRRRILTSAAALESTALLGSASRRIENAVDLNRTTTSVKDRLQALDPTGMQQANGMFDSTEVDILNHALALKHLEYAFYRDGLEAFNHDELMGAGPQ